MLSTPTAAAETHNLATQWARVSVLFIAGCTAAFHIGKIPVALPELTRNLNLSLFESSWIVSMFSVLSASLGLLIGLFAGRRNYLSAAITGFVFAGFASIVGACADTLSVLLVTRVVEGLGWILVAVSVPVLLGSVSSAANRPLVLGIWGAFVPAGMTVAILVSPVVLEGAGWQGLWLLTGSMSLVGAVAVKWVCRGVSVPPVHKLSVGAALAEVSRLAPLMMFGCFLVYSAQFVVVTAFMPTLLLEKYGLDLHAAAQLGALIIAANIVGNVAAGVLIRQQFPKHRLLVMAMMTMAVLGLIIFPDKMPLPGRVAAAIGFTTVSGMIPGTLFASAPMVVRNPLHVGVINGLILQAAGIGQLLGPPLLTGIVEASGSWSSASVFIATASFIGLVCALMLGTADLNRDNNDPEFRNL